MAIKQNEHQENVPAKRTRNAPATREAILQAARAAFAKEGYERVGVREIAAQAGVDAALVNRYFGSKEELFVAVVMEPMALADLMANGMVHLGERLVRYILQKEGHSDALNPLLILMRSSGSQTGAVLLRQIVDEQFVYPLAAQLKGPDALARAGLVATTLLGLVAMRSLVVSAAFRQADVETLVALSAPVLQAFLDGTAAPPVTPT